MSGVRLLLVDDEASLLNLLQRYLGRLGYEVETAGSAEEALARWLHRLMDFVGAKRGLAAALHSAPETRPQPPPFRYSFRPMSIRVPSPTPERR